MEKIGRITYDPGFLGLERFRILTQDTPSEPSVVIGKKLTDDALLRIGDSERKSGLYILGNPRVGKSWLMVKMILQDIENGHGVFFLDPHGDAIEDIRYRTDESVILLDPEDERYCFGINLLECPNIGSMAARNSTFTKAKGVFDKLWKNSFEEKPWLQLVLQNTLYAFIENPGLTIAELPIFFYNTDFRNEVVNNITYNWQVRDYWRLVFASKNKHDQDEEMKAAQTRAEIMLGHGYVADIVGQTRTTIDFARILRENKIVLVRLTNRLSEEAKKIIGTLLIGELRHAIEQRPPEQRSQFSIFIDEFQNFASYQDFPTLITQAPKYGIATTIAHHERYGQLAGQPEILGATAAIANKVLFQITARDAHELAPEFAEKPPTETRAEETYIISQYPVSDLLHWHDNAQISAFVNRYIRPMKERLQDIGGDTEDERLGRTQDMDIANLYRIDERLEGVSRIERDNRAITYAISSAGQAIQSAAGRTRRLITLNEEATELRLILRELNKFLTAVMEGRMERGKEEFSNFLINRICNLSAVSENQKGLLELYVAVVYGDGRLPRVIPYALAKKHGLFSDQVRRADNDALNSYRIQKSIETKKRLEQGAQHLIEMDEEIRDWQRRIKWAPDDYFKIKAQEVLETYKKRLEQSIKGRDRYAREYEGEVYEKMRGDNGFYNDNSTWITVSPSDSGAGMRRIHGKRLKKCTGELQGGGYKSIDQSSKSIVLT